MFSKIYSDYLVEVDVTNYKQLSPNDIVAVTEVGWNELKRKKAITLGAAVGAAVAAGAAASVCVRAVVATAGASDAEEAVGGGFGVSMLGSVSRWRRA